MNRETALAALEKCVNIAAEMEARTARLPGKKTRTLYLHADRTEGWQPISTAPRDGTWFIAANSKEVRAVHYDDKYDRLPINHTGRLWDELPTHWRSIPQPPQEPAHE